MIYPNEDRKLTDTEKMALIANHNSFIRNTIALGLKVGLAVFVLIVGYALLFALGIATDSESLLIFASVMTIITMIVIAIATVAAMCKLLAHNKEASRLEHLILTGTEEPMTEEEAEVEEKAEEEAGDSDEDF